jgi:hypothetical protein
MEDGVVSDRQVQTMGEAFVEKAPWRFARTMPDEPHEYTLRGETPDDDFDAFVLLLQRRGFPGTYRGRDYTYLNISGWRYWTMGEPVEKTTLINRARL